MPACSLVERVRRMGGMGRRSEPRVAVSFRLRPEAAKRIKAFLRDHAGRPLYLKPSEFAEQALIREVERLGLVLAGALPLDRAGGGEAAEGEQPIPKPINTHV